MPRRPSPRRPHAAAAPHRERPRRPRPGGQTDRGEAPRRWPSDRPQRGDRPPRNDRPQRGDRPLRDDRPARSDGLQRDVRPQRGDRPPRDGRRQRGDRPEHSQSPQRRPGKTSRRDNAPREPSSDAAGGFRPRDRDREKGALWTPGPDARVIRAEVGMDLAHFMVNHLKGRVSVRAARRYLEEGCCRINGRIETFGSRQLKRGEVVEFFLPESHEHVFDRRRMIYDQGGVIAYDKPAWLPVTPTDGPKSWSLFDILKAELGELHPVHRLDADTSGIVMFARTAEVAKRLEALFRDHAVKKSYIAIVRGHPRETGLHRSYLVKVESRRGFEKWASGRGSDAREAVTAWTVEERLGTYASRVLVEPQTGRYHQIRIHFSELGFPIYGDRLYGDRQDPIHVGRHLLHAARVELPHPTGGPALVISCRPPREFAEAEEQLKKL